MARELAGQPGGDQMQVVTEAPGFVVLTQTCDLLRPCHDRPFVELAPLVAVNAGLLEEIRKLWRPSFAYVPALAARLLVADLEATMTVEKAVLVPCAREPGITTDQEAADFARALARKRDRFAFPDAFNEAMRPLFQLWQRRHGRDSEEGHHVTALAEIRAAADNWHAQRVSVLLWLIKNSDPDPERWAHYAEQWGRLFDDPTGVFSLDGGVPRIIRLADMKASEYVASHHLDLDRLTPPAAA